MGFFDWLFGDGEPALPSVAVPPGRPAHGLPPEFQDDGAFRLQVVGEMAYQDAITAIAGGKRELSAELEVTATLCLEDDNPKDSKAVRVEIGGRTVGYLTRDKARKYRNRLEDLGLGRPRLRCPALVVGGWDRGSGDTGYFGVRLDLNLTKRKRRA